MNKNFLKSVAVGIMGLSLVASCSSTHSKKDSNTCGAKNGCAAKKDEANKCSAVKKDEANKCSAAKTKAAKPAKAKKAKTTNSDSK